MHSAVGNDFLKNIQVDPTVQLAGMKEIIQIVSKNISDERIHSRENHSYGKYV